MVKQLAGRDLGPHHSVVDCEPHHVEISHTNPIACRGDLRLGAHTLNPELSVLPPPSIHIYIINMF